MKVVLFCGGLGTRLREFSDTIPKPLVHVGHRPIIWNLMKYYAHYGHKDFILCLGYRGDLIKEYFLQYNEAISNNFTLSNGGRTIELENSDIQDWRITFVDTGLKSNIGQRLKAVEPYVKNEEMFLANYSDGLSDLPLPEVIETFKRKQAIASFVSVRPSQSFHAVETGPDGLVTNIEAVGGTDFWINGGFFVLRREIFDYMRDGEELVEQPFQRLIPEKKLIAYRYTGFWMAMDTFKDKKNFDTLYETGDMPWQVWDKK
ncbi:MAG TPA: sugar phosphate nucleotidyltransferase [Acidiferrobacterales bacterium]|jgi:glucose-1-phosphate cytidylyltransferase